MRPRFGLMRGREFCMKDAYSFHADEASLNDTYLEMINCYHRIFKRCSLAVQSVEADSGDIGGSESAEFMILSETGEDTIMVCSKSNTALNNEAAPIKSMTTSSENKQELIELSRIHTPNCSTISDLSELLNRSSDQLLKSLLFVAGDQLILILVRGDHSLNELKLKKILGVDSIEPASKDVVESFSGAKLGFLGPLNTQKMCDVYVDQSIDVNGSYVIGANKDDYHYEGFNPDRDLETYISEDLRFAIEGDQTPWGGEYKSVRGIEVGHVFKLGNKYSNAMDAQFMSENGRPASFEMGCYGIGVGRTLAAAIEQNHDDKGICWPKELAPFDIHLICVNPKQEPLKDASESLYTQLMEHDFDVLFDDRLESPGIKFKDADLIGVPIQIILGKSFAESGKVEVKNRSTHVVNSVDYDKVFDFISSLSAVS